MSLKETINNDIKDAMRAKEQAVLLALRAIKAAIINAETAEGHVSGVELTEAEELQLLTKQAKQRRDSIDSFRKNNRIDLAEKEEAELAVIERYLPKQLTAEELEAEIRDIIAEVGATSPKDMGKVMAGAKRLSGRADGRLISEKVKQLLQ